MKKVPLLEVRSLRVGFPIYSKFARRNVGAVQAVAGVSFDLSRGEALGLVGESGSGKSTLARAIMGLERPTGGSVHFRGFDVTGLVPSDSRRDTRNMQMVFQDPYGSLNPRLTVFQLVSEGWEIHPEAAPSGSWRQEVGGLLERVGISPDACDRYPHTFSGGQRQRIGIARALAMKPELLICDEPVSALDVSIQAQILNLLHELRRDLDLTLLIIAHDLAVVKRLCSRVMVMYLGQIMETGTADAVYSAPSHPYTQALLSAVPPLRPWNTDRRKIVLEGDIPSPSSPPSGCRFRTRCWKADDRCSKVDPPLIHRTGATLSACHYAEVGLDGL